MKLKSCILKGKCSFQYPILKNFCYCIKLNSSRRILIEKYKFIYMTDFSYLIVTKQERCHLYTNGLCSLPAFPLLQ